MSTNAKTKEKKKKFIDRGIKVEKEKYNTNNFTNDNGNYSINE